MSQPENEAKKGMSKKPVVDIGIDAVPKGEWKILGGGDRDQWNKRISRLIVNALPVDRKNAEATSDAGSAVVAGVVDMRPTDPNEGVLISQIVTANEAALEFYRRGWTNADAGYFDAGTKYLALADKAARTVVLLTERLDHHRNRGQQKIVVQHTTVHADQAVVATGNATDPALLTASVEKPLRLIGKTIGPESVGVG
jgi:glycine/D-amino acid oxidase-like deaminating enzyme